MDTLFPTDNEDVYSNLDSIPKSVCNTDTEISEDIPNLLIDGQPHPLIIYDYLEKYHFPSTKENLIG